MHNKIAITDIKEYFINLQNSIILELENFTESKFLRDKWERLKGGGGVTSIFENGKIIEIRKRDKKKFFLYFRFRRDFPLKKFKRFKFTDI